MSAPCWRCDGATYDNPDTHATEAQHPVCGHCRRSLRFEESGACQLCIARLQQNLADCVDAYERLPEAAQQVGGSRFQHPGGRFLVLAGPGSEGKTQLSGARLSTGGTSTAHERDEHASDPPSVAYELGSLEHDWRRHLGHPAPQPPATGQLSRPRAYLEGVVRQAAAYLQQHAAWCAATYPDGFAEAAETVHGLRQRMHGALGLLEPRQARAFCLDCASQLEVDGDVWVCTWCGASATPGEYLTALRAGLEARHAG